MHKETFLTIFIINLLKCQNCNTFKFKAKIALHLLKFRVKIDEIESIKYILIQPDKFRVKIDFFS